jgi:threonine/homoserine/homoserine lactone efflux protein
VSTTAIDSSYLAFLTFTVILVATPGATTAVVVRNTLEGGRRAGYVTALGAATGSVVIAVGCALGLSMLLAVWPGSLNAIRIGGAAFLAWLGALSLYRAWTKTDGGIRLALDPGWAPSRSHGGAYFADGLAVHLLSPVLISYYLSVVPSFIPANASRLYYSGLAATHVSLALCGHALWATALDFMRRWFVQPGRRKLLQAASGLALIGLALRILL